MLTVIAREAKIESWEVDQLVMAPNVVWHFLNSAVDINASWVVFIAVTPLPSCLSLSHV